ncbi:MAG: hypothetical protein FWF95_01235 [Syntrophorhabdaceae bacterium]|nr:hypothetical protein [Syntrophorhabdaceae bacterium]
MEQAACSVTIGLTGNVILSSKESVILKADSSYLRPRGGDDADGSIGRKVDMAVKKLA